MSSNDESDRKIILHPVINSLQKLAVYDLKDWLYIVGTNNEQTSFRLLRISRMEAKNLVIKDDGKEYSSQEIQGVISKDNKSGKAATRSVSAFGIVGFVKFMEGYYMILITKRRPVAAIGLHYVYKIEETAMFYIPCEAIRVSHADEHRYLKMFQSVDLSSNFYFSYSYDITNTLQVNMAVPKVLADNIEKQKDNKKRLWEYDIRSRPNRRFVWNEHLTSAVEDILHPDWILHVTHGFVGQSVLSIFGRPVNIALIARRSNKYAGTRFLKRGANFDGDVANEVETEQIVEDMGVSSWQVCPRISSFVQIRGSVPGHWSQDVTKIVAKPAISYDLSDPFGETAGKHFRSLIERYGTPIVVVNLVKQREKKKHESTLSDQYITDISYLNQFLAPQHHIVYVPFDMARKNKGSKANVLGRLARIAESNISKTGIYFCAKDTEQLQTGIIRVNCVDCLDRTNTAQFALGKYALAKQLKKLGLFGDEQLDFDCDCTRLLEVLYEDHGDTLALQYGGSQLVHRIKTYRKTAPWTSQGNDIMQTLSRYYSNTFSDAEKQHAMNLFLGLFKPYENDIPIWETMSDFYLHNPSSRKIPRLLRERLPITQWWGEEEVDNMSLAVRCRNAIVTPLTSKSPVDAYSDFHRPHEYTYLSTVFTFNMCHTIRDFAPPNVSDLSPFTVRSSRRREDVKGGRSAQYSSASSNTSSDSSLQESEEDEVKTECSTPTRQSAAEVPNSPWSKALPPIVKLQLPSPQDMSLYQRYVLVGKQATDKNEKYLDPEQLLMKTLDGSKDRYKSDVPKVSKASLDLYEKYVSKKYDTLGACIMSDQVEKYARYRNNQLFIYPAVGWDY
ncbi:SacI homology domain [Nesidiocoris tenuis]|uniref:SacI homology domain n=1 Tax=Nesidiocoris tenuis TaxID=355587 RepID=A0ABN7B4Y8_9HEMI|nr:SacI homology domain [Nesidiocoris tenuis]